jgi:hypothetical protein
MGVAALAACFVLLWLLQHPGKGIVHDAVLYTLQALAHLRPDLLGDDLFLRFGSQDRFTVFGPVYAAAIAAFGMENAARLLVVISQAGLFAAAAVLARVFMPARLAWLAVAFVCLLPGDYGARGVFMLVEDFITPRCASQALVLAGIALVYGQRPWLALLPMLAAAALHPLMALGGGALLLLVWPMDVRRRIFVICAAAASAVAVLIWMASRSGQWVFDDAWWQLLNAGTPYLFPSSWNMQDWTNTAFALVLPLAGGVVLEDPRARGLCRAVVGMALLGLLLAWLGADLLRSVALTQLQTWRWTWLAAASSLLFAPLLGAQLWRTSAAGRLAVLLGVAAWLLHDESAGLPLMLAAAAVAIVAARGAAVSPRVAKACLIAGIAVVVVAAAVHLLSLYQSVTATFGQSSGSRMIRILQNLRETGQVPAVIFCALVALVRRARERMLFIAAAAGSVAMIMVLLAGFGAASAAVRARAGEHAALAGWRAMIPPGVEVLWFDDPLSCWSLLERPSYVSNEQGSSALFSRAAAMETWRRLRALDGFLRNEAPAWLDVLARTTAKSVTLASVCAASNVRFIVTRDDLGPARHALPDSPPRLRGVWLYSCPSSS